MKIYSIKIDNKQISLLQTIISNINISESEAVKLIHQGSVWNDLRNTRLKDNSKILRNDTIVVVYPQYPITEYTLNQDHIKFEDDDLIIVYKEHGINTCPSPFSDIDCLSHGIQKYLNNKNIDYNVFTINRLDKPTGGLVFFAKNKKTEINLHNMFRERKIKKFYLCATKIFELQKEAYLINDLLEWKNKSYEASTYIKFIKQKHNFYYFFVHPMTGRTHQIRKHFQKYLHPIIGDCLYGEDYTRNDKLMLLCYGYKFYHPYTKEKIYIEYIPEDFGCLHISR